MSDDLKFENPVPTTESKPRKILNPNEAFGLPRGTVRGLLSLVLVSTLCYMVITEKNIPDNFNLLVGGVVGAYFTDRILSNRRNTNGNGEYK